jgi:integrase/recombinase XerD
MARSRRMENPDVLPLARIAVSAMAGCRPRIVEAACRPGDLLEDEGSRSHHAASSNQKVVRGYGTWLGWLASRGLLRREEAPRARINRRQIGLYLQDLQRNCSTCTVINRLEDLYSAARALVPDDDWSWIRAVISRVRSRYVPVDNRRDRVVNPAELLKLGCQLMDRAGHEPTAIKKAVVHRDGLIIAILSTRPLRLKNLVGLELHRSFLLRGNKWWIDIPGSDTKTGAPVEMPLPAALASRVEVYLDEHCPVLAGRQGRWTRPSGNALWISSDGSPMRDRSVHQQIVVRTREGLGHPVNPHLFRTCVATAIATEDPDHFAITAPLLGDGLATVGKYYDKARSTEAVRRHQGLILGIRDGAVELYRDEEDEV